MKKTFSLLFVFLMCMIASSPCFASGFENLPVVDEAGFLSDSEFKNISEELDELREKYNFDVAIVTESNRSGKNETQVADNIYDYSGYGAGKNDDGILFYISESPRKYHITAHGDGTRAFNKNGMAYLKKKIEPYLKKNDYYGAMNKFADLSDELLEMAANGKPYNEKPEDTKRNLIIIGCCVLIPLILAWILMQTKLSQMKTAVENNYAANYMKPGSMNISLSRDIFLYSHITKTEKPKNNSDTHKSSSGRTHTGAGGSY